MNQAEFDDILEEEVMIAASESCGPNSPEYTRVCETLRDNVRFAKEVAQRYGVMLDDFGEVMEEAFVETDTPAAGD